jgi:hypothetical protein
MDIPINCPICGDPLINTFNETINKVVYKNCRLRPDHIFSCAVYLPGFMDIETDTLERMSFTLSMNPPLSVQVWHEDNNMAIDKCVPNMIGGLTNDSNLLPFYVEPTFSDYPSYSKWCQKVKTYILFM